MSLPIQLALVPDGVHLNLSDITRVAAALSKQAERDFRPLWHVSATVDGFSRLEDVPIDYWPIIIQQDVQGAAGFHEDDNGQPFAVVEMGHDWSLTASHEVLEMLADPFGRRMRAANLLPQAVALGLPKSRVRYLVEVCDACEDGQFSYTVNGVTVSDFYTPHFFDPVKVPGVRYSFTGAVSAPVTVLKNGYISWQNPITGHWLQLRMFADEFSTHTPHVLDLTAERLLANFQPGQSIRAAIDRVTKTPVYQGGIPHGERFAARPPADQSYEDQVRRADQLRNSIQRLNTAE